MKKFLAILVVTFMLPCVSFADGEKEDLQLQYQKVVAEFQQNLETQQFIVEGFKAKNATYQALVSRQAKLQQMAKSLADKMKALEAPEAPEPIE